MKKKKLSPLAAAIVEGLNEAISYANGEQRPTAHKFPDNRSKYFPKL